MARIGRVTGPDDSSTVTIATVVACATTDDNSFIVIATIEAKTGFIINDTHVVIATTRVDTGTKINGALVVIATVLSIGVESGSTRAIINEVLVSVATICAKTGIFLDSAFV